MTKKTHYNTCNNTLFLDSRFRANDIASFPYFSYNILLSYLFKTLQCLLLFAILNSLTVRKAHADAQDTLGTIMDAILNLTCESQGVGDLLSSEFSHTCIPAPFFTFAIANIVSPGLYPDAILKLKINDTDLFNDKNGFPGGQCTRQNRLDPTAPALTFAICNNIKLQLVKATLLPKAAIAIAKAVLTGDDPWDDIKAFLIPDKASYHDFFPNESEGYLNTTIDVPPVIFKVIQINDRLCVATPALPFSWVAVGCKYIKEPYPVSIYASFMDLGTSSNSSNNKSNDSILFPTAIANSSTAAVNNQATDPTALVNCGTATSGSGQGCYQRAYTNSKTAIVISSPLIECIKEMTARLLISNDVCTIEDINAVINSAKRETSTLFQFQRNMHRVVTGFLTLYVMLFGFKMLLSGKVPEKAEVMNFIIKIFFVTYFSVGLNITPGSNSDYNKLDGMTQFTFPLLLEGINSLAGWVMSAAPSDLCRFTGKDINYNTNLSYLALWDALDCRIAHYLGLDVLSTLLEENVARNHDFKNFDFFSFSAPPYVYLLIPALYTGNMTVVSLALAYPLLVISVGAFMINATIMCMISIVILGILAPLFVPMILFEYTRSYFESWVKLLISFLLQPMVVVTFMILMFSVYDYGFYGKCQYTSQKIDNSVSAGGDGVRDDVRVFFIDNNWQNYPEGASGNYAKSCQNSLGYMLNNPLQTAFNLGTSSLNQMVTDLPGTVSTSDYTSKFDFLGGIILGQGMFFLSPKVIFEKLQTIVIALITACFTLYLMYHFSAQLAEFAADMTEGVPLNNVTINPQSIYKAGMAALNAIKQAKAGDKTAGGKGRAGDKLAGGRGGAADLFAGGANDTPQDTAATDDSSAGALVPVQTESQALVPAQTKSGALVSTKRESQTLIPAQTASGELVSAQTESQALVLASPADSNISAFNKRIHTATRNIGAAEDRIDAANNKIEMANKQSADAEQRLADSLSAKANADLRKIEADKKLGVAPQDIEDKRDKAQAAADKLNAEETKRQAEEKLKTAIGPEREEAEKAITRANSLIAGADSRLAHLDTQKAIKDQEQAKADRQEAETEKQKATADKEKAEEERTKAENEKNAELEKIKSEEAARKEAEEKRKAEEVTRKEAEKTREDQGQPVKTLDQIFEEKKVTLDSPNQTLLNQATHTIEVMDLMPKRTEKQVDRVKLLAKQIPLFIDRIIENTPELQNSRGEIWQAIENSAKTPEIKRLLREARNNR